jgi:hypothetical protein
MEVVQNQRAKQDVSSYLGIFFCFFSDEMMNHNLLGVILFINKKDVQICP